MKTYNREIENEYYVEEKCEGLIQYIIRKSDNANIATLDRFSTEIMGYGMYKNIMETITCCYTKKEFPVLQYFFGYYFNDLERSV